MGSKSKVMPLKETVGPRRGWPSTVGVGLGVAVCGGVSLGTGDGVAVGRGVSVGGSSVDADMGRGVCVGGSSVGVDVGRGVCVGGGSVDVDVGALSATSPPTSQASTERISETKTVAIMTVRFI
jgi:hypothetical protein